MRKTGLLMIVSIMLVASMLICACGSATKDVSDGTVPSGQTETSNETKTDDVAKDVTITYCNFNSSGGNEETLNKMYEAFHEEYPNITVKIETIGYDDYFTQMQTRVAGGTAPDCYELNIENFAAYANKGLLAEITGADTSAINQTALNAFNVNGKQYGLPESFSNVVLFYNKDLFDKAGVSYPTSDWTQADLQNAAEKIRALDENTFGIRNDK